MNILFMGTPDFAVPSLEALATAPEHTVCGVFSQSDKPKNRGMKCQPTPVKVCAERFGIPVYQPEKLRDGTALDLIKMLEPELIAVAAYGRILPREILEYPRYGCINVHSSLLPKYRGAAPINWAILNGEQATGVTIMDMAEELDAGDIILQEETPIGAEENADELYARLAAMGGALLIKAVAQIADGTAVHTAQAHDAHTLAPMLSKALSPVNWNKSAQEIHCQIRGLLPWPAATTDVISGAPMKLFASRVAGERSDQLPGTILHADKTGISLVCGGGSVLCITELQPSGGKRMGAADYLRGHPIQTG
ncbi:MAG: methionyl-tRNA formyltransferase [Oscillospiraceae bacterium]|nr:methionyl-tRNA formyltransferase [Oscillospiraceae bacterium]